MIDNTPLILNPDLSDKEKQEIFLTAYRKAEAKEKTIKNVCLSLKMPRSLFTTWLADPEFEEKFFAELRAFSYSLTEELATTSAALLEDEVSISKGRYYALTIAQKSILEVVGKLNRERFGESTEVRLKQDGNIYPQINISLVSADIPAIDVTPQVNIETVKSLDNLKDSKS